MHSKAQHSTCLSEFHARAVGVSLIAGVLQIAFTRKKDFGKEERALKWAHAQRTLHGLQPPDAKLFPDRVNELNQMAEEAKRRAEIAR
jgi:hypothetical protein